MKLGHVPRSCVLSPRLLFCLSAVLARSAFANPVGEHVSVGTAKFDRSGNLLQISTDQQNTIIDWQAFSIAAGEQTKFLQPGADAATLNRVTGGNPTQIYGSLESNGKIFLLNPNGILVGLTGRIDTAGFLASTLNVSNAEFLAGGDLRFSGTSTAAVDNRGRIGAAGGDIYLLGAKVSNSGTLKAPDGNVGLGAGSQILLKQAGNERVSVRPKSAAGRIDNAGTIEAIQAELKAHSNNLYALAINNTGVVRATGALYRDGRVLLTSDGGTVSDSGRIVAKNAKGGGGSVRIHGGQVLVTGTVDASATVGSGTTGGVVQISGTNVGLFGAATVNASGDTGGGSISIGGGLHGTDSFIQNALHTVVASQASIRADALTAGNGGQVVVWSDNATRFFGSISAHGAGIGGNGGFAEVSGKQYLNFKGRTDLAGSGGGKAGTLLMDPGDILLTDGTDGDPLVSGTQFTDGSTDSTFAYGAGGSFAGVGSSTTIELQAQHNITVTGTGFDVAIATGASDVSLTLRAGNDIHVNAPIIVSGSGALLIEANSSTDPIVASGTGSVFVSSAGLLSTESGSMTISGQTVHIDNGGLLTTSGGPIAISASDIAITGTIAIPAYGNVSLISSGSITEAGVGSIQTDVLAIQSVNGMRLDGYNAINQLQAINSGTGAIVVNNYVSPFSIIGITQQTGDVRIVNNGAVLTSGTIQTLGAGNISITANGGPLTIDEVIANGSTGNISLTTSGVGDITLNAQLFTTGVATLNSAGFITGGGVSGAGGVSGSSVAVLNTTAVNGIVLNGSNNVAVFSANNSTANDVVFINSGPAVAISGITNNGGDIVLNASGALAIAGPVVTSTNGSVFLTAGDVLTQTAGGSISTPNLVTYSVGGTNLSGSNAVALLTGTNTGGGDFVFNGASPSLTIQQVAQPDGGNISVVNSGALILPATLTAGTGTVTVGGATISGVTNFGLSTVGFSSQNSVAVSANPAAGADVTLAVPLAALGNVTTGGPFSLDTQGMPLIVTGTVSSRGITLAAGTGSIEVDGALRANNGPLVLTSDSISLQGPVDGMGMAYFQTSTPTLNVLLGSAASSGSSTLGDYKLDDASLGHIGSNFAGVVFGGDQSSQMIFVQPPSGFAFTSSVFLNAPFHGGVVEIDSPLAAAGYAAVSINANTVNLAVTGGDAISTAHQNVSLSGVVWLKNDTSISTAGGNFSHMGTLDGSNSLTVTTGNGSISFWGATSNQTGGSIGGHQALASLNLASSGIINLLPDITTTGDQTYGAPGGASAINRFANGRSRSVGDGNITFNGPLIGANGVTLGVSTTGTSSPSGTVFFNGAVTSGSSGGLNVTADQISFSGTVNINGGAIALAPGTVGHALELGGSSNSSASHYDLSTLVRNNSSFTFGNGTTGPVTIYDGFSVNCPLTVYSGSTVMLSGSLMAPGVSLQGRLNALAGSITSPNQPVTLKAVQLTDSLVIDTGTANGAVKFLETVSGNVATDLTVKSGSGAVTFMGAAGSATAPIGDVDLQTTGTVTIQNGLQAASFRDTTAGNTLLSGSIQATSGDIIIGNKATLTGATTLAAANGSVTLGGSLTETGLSPLTINSIASVSQHGGWQLPGSVTINAGAGNIVLSSSANTFGTMLLAGSNATVNANGPVTLGNCNLSGSLAVISSGFTTTVVSSSNALVSSTTFVSGTVSDTETNSVVTSGTAVIISPGSITESGAVSVSGPAFFETTVIPGATTTVTNGSSAFTRTTVFSGSTVYTGTVVDSSTTTTLTPGPSGSITLDNAHNSFAKPVTLVSGSNATLVNGVSGTVSLVNCTVPNLLKVQNVTTGDILVPASNSFGSLGLVGRNAIVTSATGVQLAATTLTGSLSLTAAGSITQSSAPVVVSGSGTSSFRSTVADSSIVLSGSSNQFPGPVSFFTSGSAGNVSLQNTVASVMASGSVGGNLSVTSAGSIGQATGSQLLVGGTASFTAATAITLNNTGNWVGGNLAMAGATVGYSGFASGFGPIRATTLKLTPTCDVTQSGQWQVTGSTAVSATGHNITLADSTSTYGPLSLSGSNVVLNAAAPVALGNSIVSGSLSVVSTGAITQSGSLRVTGVSLFKTTGAGSSITLSNSNNSFASAVTLLSGSDATLSSAATGTTTLVNSSVPALLKVQVPSTGDISVPSSNSFGSLGMTGRNATVASGASVQLAATTLSGTLSLTAGGSIGQLAPITINGAGLSAFTAGTDAAIVLNLTSNRFAGPLSFNTSGTAGSVTLQNALSTTIGGGTVNGNLTVQSSGAIGQTPGSQLSVSGSAAFTAATTVQLNNAGNSIGRNLALIGSTVGYTGSAGGFGPIRASALTLYPTCDVLEAGPWRVAGVTSINSTHNIVLQDLSNSFGTLRLTGGDISVWQGPSMNLGVSAASGNLSLVSAAGNIVTSGPITAGGNLSMSSSTGTISAPYAFSITGSSSFSAGSSITLNSLLNSFLQPVAFNARGTGSILFVNNTDTTLAGVQTNANVTLRSAGNIQQTGSISVPGSVTLTATNGDVTLTDPLNRIGLLTMTARNATVDTGSSLKLGTINLSGSLGLVARGSVTEAGLLTVPNSVAVSTSGSTGVVTLTLRNSISGPISVSTDSGADASITNAKPISLVGSNVGGILSLNTPGAILVDASNTVNRFGAISAASLTVSSPSRGIVQTAPWKVSGTVQLAAASNDIVLGANNTFGPLQISGNNLSVHQIGSITQAGPIIATGSSNFTATGAILLGNRLNSLSGPVSLNTPSYAVLGNGVVTTFGNSTVGSTLTVTGSNDIVQAPNTALNAPGTLTLTSAGSILLSNSANQLKNLGFIAASASGSISIASSAGMLTLNQTVGAQNVTIQTTGALTLGGQALITGHRIWLAAIGVNGSFVNNASASGILNTPSAGDIFQIYSYSRSSSFLGALRTHGLSLSGSYALPAPGVFVRSDTSTFVYATP